MRKGYVLFCAVNRNVPPLIGMLQLFVDIIVGSVEIFNEPFM